MTVHKKAQGKGKPTVLIKSAVDFYRIGKVWHRVFRRVDREQNWYSEEIRDEQTGEVVRAVEEPLVRIQAGPQRKALETAPSAMSFEIAAGLNS